MLKVDAPCCHPPLKSSAVFFLFFFKASVKYNTSPLYLRGASRRTPRLVRQPFSRARRRRSDNNGRPSVREFRGTSVIAGIPQTLRVTTTDGGFALFAATSTSSRDRRRPSAEVETAVTGGHVQDRGGSRRFSTRTCCHRAAWRVCY